MCGGAGTRLWPASREVRPKQFLPLFGKRSTFQDTLLRVSDADLFDRPPERAGDRLFRVSFVQDAPVLARFVLLATGVANLAGGFLSAMPAGGGTSQTAVVRSVGGRTQTASLVTAAAALLVMLVLAPLIRHLPQPALAAFVIVYSIGLIQPAEFLAIRKVRTMEFRWALTACVCVPIFGTLQGIVIAIANLITTESFEDAFVQFGEGMFHPRFRHESTLARLDTQLGRLRKEV